MLLCSMTSLEYASIGLITQDVGCHTSRVKDYGVPEHTLLWDKRAGLKAYFNNVGVEIMWVDKISRSINIFKLTKEYEHVYS